MPRTTPTLLLLLALAACGKDDAAVVPETGAPAAALPPSANPSATRAQPDTTSMASTYDDGGGGPVKVVGETVDGDKLRARARARLSSDLAPVVVLRGGTAKELGERLCAAVVPMRAAETPILLKPNLGGFDSFKDPQASGGDDGVKGRITDPEFVRGVIQCLKARGHTRLTVADGWGGSHKDWQRLVRMSGYEEMTKSEGVPLIAMNDDGVFDKEEPKPGRPLKVRGMEKTEVPNLLMPQILADHLDNGLFISIPKLKAHRYSVVSLGIKSLQGTVMLSDAAPAYKQKWRMHKELLDWLKGENRGKDERASYVKTLERFAARMADVLEIEAPDAVLAEGAPAMGGDGFQKLWPSAENVAVGGTNTVLVDRVGAELLGLWNNKELSHELRGHATSPLLEVAARKIGVDIESPKVTGDGAGLLREPRPVHFVGMAGFAIHSDKAPPGNAAPPAPVTRLTARAPLVEDSAVVIDGTGSDPAWKKAVPVSWDTDFAGKKTGILTQARFLWSRSALYVLFELDGAGFHTDASKPVGVERAGLYKEDCVELFFTPDARRRTHYYEMEIGPFGHFLDLEVDKERRFEDTAWSSGAKIATTRDTAAHRAIIEVAFRAKEIVDALTEGANIPIGLFRTEGDTARGAPPRAYLAWSPAKTAKPNFHVPEAFGDSGAGPVRTAPALRI